MCCVEENRDNGEIKKTKDEDVAEKKREKKKKKVLCWLYVWCGARVEQIFFFLSKLTKNILY